MPPRLTSPPRVTFAIVAPLSFALVDALIMAGRPVKRNHKVTRKSKKAINSLQILTLNQFILVQIQAWQPIDFPRNNPVFLTKSGVFAGCGKLIGTGGLSVRCCPPSRPLGAEQLGLGEHGLYGFFLKVGWVRRQSLHREISASQW